MQRSNKLQYPNLWCLWCQACISTGKKKCCKMFLVFLLLHLALVEFSVLIANLDVFMSLRNYVAEVDWKFRVFWQCGHSYQLALVWWNQIFFTFLSCILARHFNGLYFLSYCSLIFACHYLIPSGRYCKMRRGSWRFSLCFSWNLKLDWRQCRLPGQEDLLRWKHFLWEFINIVCLHISNSLCI